MNSVCNLFNIQFPIIQAGMIWCSGWRLASAVSNAGGLGIIGAGSMYPDVLKLHIEKCKAATNKPFGVNVPLLYPDVDQLMQIIVSQKVPIVITSAGNPKTWTKHLKDNGIKVVHVVSNSKFAIKSVEAGVDAVVAEGFEAGGHNGREETTTFCLIPMVRKSVKIPLIAAGGIATGQGMLAAMVLGAEAVQMGTRFVATLESSAHDSFKHKVLNTKEGDTMLAMKKLVSVRLIKNNFYQQVAQAEANGATPDQLMQLLGRGRAKKGMFEGDMDEGELEIGQIASLLDAIKPAADVVHQIIEEFNVAKTNLSNYQLIPHVTQGLSKQDK